MPRFATRNGPIMVSTSYKVMYSSFVESGLFDELTDTQFAALAAGRRNMPGFRHLAAVRDPYDRLTSFFADKLRRDLERGSGNWQYCQLMFFPLLGIRFDESFERARDALLGISFEQFIDWLPKLCWNGHLRKQVSLLSAAGVDLKAETEIFHIETEAGALWSALGVTTPPRANFSEATPDHSKLARERLDIINTIYADDFDAFGYPPR